jgi:hypothetical protein
MNLSLKAWAEFVLAVIEDRPAEVPFLIFHRPATWSERRRVVRLRERFPGCDLIILTYRWEDGRWRRAA